MVCGVEIRIGDEVRPQHIGDLPAGKFGRAGGLAMICPKLSTIAKTRSSATAPAASDLREQLRRQRAHRLSVRHIGGKCRNDILRRELRMQNGKAVLLGEMAAAALHQLRRAAKCRAPEETAR